MALGFHAIIFETAQQYGMGINASPRTKSVGLVMAIGRRCPGWMLFLVGAICVLSLFLVSVLFDSRLQVEPIDDGTCVLFDTGWSLFVTES